MAIDVALLDRALAFARDNPERHHQQEWRCETGECMAGHIALLSGAQWLLPDVNDAHVVDPEGTRWHVSDYASHVAGLSLIQADDLFDSHNTLEEIEEIVKDFKNGVGVDD